MPKILHLSVICACAIGAGGPGFAQTMQIKGTVLATTTPVQNSSVTFEDKAHPGVSTTVLTDSAGRYQLALTPTAVGPENALPGTFALAQNYPNPFTSSTSIPYELKTHGEAKIAIYDILGRVVRQSVVGSQPAGAHRLLWDGRDGTGRRLSPGVYFYSLQSGGESQVRKMIMQGGVGTIVSPSPPVMSPVSTAGTIGTRTRTAAVYTVRIENTGVTFPSIQTLQADNVTIAADTTLNFLVERTTPVTVVTVSPDSTQQRIRGFGAANILQWRPDMTTGQVQKAFGSGPGQLGFTILRLRIPYSGSVSDFALQLPTATLARSLGAIVFASPWTPPASMKSNNNIVGGMLSEASYAAYATHLKSFVEYMASNGAPLYAVSLQNEPDASVTYESCSWNATQFLNFTKVHAGSVGAKIIMPESLNFNHGLSDSTLNDPAAAANVSIIGGHLYGAGLAPYPLAVSKGKELWMTEHLDLDTTWTGVFNTGVEMLNCMNAGMHAYVWWYLVRYYGPMGEDGSVTKRGYVMSQFARFIRPGYVRISCNAAPQRKVMLSAFRDSSSSKMVFVAINTGTARLEQGFTVAGGAMTAFIPYTTSQGKNCVEGVPYAVQGGSFTAVLDPSSITTFVSQ